MSERKSSINIQSGHTAEFFHNTRETPTKNSIFSTQDNYTNLTAKQSLSLYNQELQARTQLYTNRTGQKLQKKAITLLSSVINLKANSTKEDVEKVCKLLEQKLNTKVIQYSIHQDEGHTTSKGEKVVNYHAHILFMGLDNSGVSVRKKLDKKMLRELQTDVAICLNMERGKENSKTKRLSTYDYKTHREIMYKERLDLVRQANTQITKLIDTKKTLLKENEELKEKSKIGADKDESFFDKLAKVKDLKSTINTLRAELKQANSTREDYAKLEQLAKDLKTQVKNKDLTIQQLQSRIELFKSDDILVLKDKAKKYDEIAEQYESVREFVTQANKQLKEKDIEIEELKEENQELKNKVKDLEKQLENVNKELDEYTMAR